MSAHRSKSRVTTPGIALALLGIALAGGLLWRHGATQPVAAPSGRSTLPASVVRTGNELRPRVVPGPRDLPAKVMREAQGDRITDVDRAVGVRPRQPSREPEASPTHDQGIRAYAAAVDAGDKRPGEKAFRADAKAFFEHNAQLAEEKAAREGITLEELEELTYMGTLAMHIRRWDVVEQVLGHELSAEQQTLGDELIFASSNALKASIRGQVASGASVEERWTTIRAQQASFIEKYLAITKLTPEGFDTLLAVPSMTEDN